MTPKAGPCGKMLSKWAQEYESECILPEKHEGLHFDGFYWFNDDGDDSAFPEDLEAP